MATPDDASGHQRAMDIKTVSLVASRQVWSIIAALFAIILGMGGYWLQTVYAEGQETQRTAQTTKADVQSLTTQTKADVKALSDRLDSIDASQERIERSARENFDKLDRKLDALITRELDK